MAEIEQVRKIDNKNGKNCMHRDMPPDAFPGSATLVRVLDRWLNDWTPLSNSSRATPTIREHQRVDMPRDSFSMAGTQ